MVRFFDEISLLYILQFESVLNCKTNSNLFYFNEHTIDTIELDK
jgi:hypothetical protein